MLRRLLPDELGISVSYPLPGTPFYDRVRDELGLKRNWQDSDDLAMLFEGPYGTRFYRHLHGTRIATCAGTRCAPSSATARCSGVRRCVSHAGSRAS